ncbi:MAG TPA: hypothetical protein PLO53_15385 [Candidatus Hydrogenedentes bacterium]|nr:hypothetical protein [Candidatus Hydrogenedentota bacterium]HPU99323.1 hypothetical protein [Candidatus Hydrogenedentota bacterium]
MANNTNNGSGSPGEAPGISDYQRRWRKAGIICLILAALMAWQGASMPWQGWWFAVLWWGGMLLLLGAALYTVALDLRYTALLRKLEERKIFLETFGDPEFRRKVRALAEAQNKPTESPPQKDDHGED